MVVLILTIAARAQIADVFPDKARYQPGTDANISVELHQSGSAPVSGNLRVKVRKGRKSEANFPRKALLSCDRRRIGHTPGTAQTT